jgi:outer membrane protein assembly factor BamB
MMTHRPSHFLRVLSPILASFLLLAVAQAGDWPQYRGPQRDGISKETGWRTDWPKDGLKVLWKATVGKGYSSVAVADDRVYTLGLLPKTSEAKDDSLEETISCFEAPTGKLLWRHSYPSQLIRQYPGTRSTPTVDGKHVYTYGQFAELLCLDAATGKVTWQKLLMKDHGAQSVTYGYAASPLIVDDLVIVPARILVKDAKPGSPGNALLLAFKKSTGEEVWRFFYESSHLGGGYWGCPVPCKINGKDTLVYSCGSACLGVAPRTGALLWKYDFAAEDLMRAKGRNGCCAQEPVIAGNRIVCCIHPVAAEGLTVCLEVEGEQVKEVWRTTKLGNYTSGNIIWQGHLFGIHHNDLGTQVGPLCCFDMQTGTLKWERRDVGGVLALVDDKMFSFTGQQVILFAASAEGYKELARSQPLFGADESKARNSDKILPVLSNGRLYCRSHGGTLHCLDLRLER